MPFWLNSLSKIKEYFSKNLYLNIGLIFLLFVYIFLTFFLDDFGGGVFYKIAKIYNFKYLFI